MDSSRPIISLQVGHYANFIGSHFWNAQENRLVYSAEQLSTGAGLDHDVLYREGLTPLSGLVTYTPRLVALDLKGSLGSLPQFGTLYDELYVPEAATDKGGLQKEAHKHWQGEVSVQIEEPAPQTSFLKRIQNSGKIPSQVSGHQDVSQHQLNLDDEVVVWSDFLKARFHPRTNILVKEYQHDCSLRPFSTFGLGEKVDLESAEDSIRFFAEECGYLGGFHLISDANNAFGGCASELIHHLRDEYSGKTLICFPSFSAQPSSGDWLENASSFLNFTLTLRSQLLADLVSPVSVALDPYPLGHFRQFSGVAYKPESNYHTSAILATAIDSMTIPWRLKQFKHRISDVASSVSWDGRKVASSAVSFLTQDWFTQHNSLAERLQRHSDESFKLMPVTPGLKAGNVFEEGVLAQSISTFGLDQHLKPRDFNLAEDSWQKLHASNRYLRCESSSEALLHFFHSGMPGTKTGLTCVDQSYPIGEPFPGFFSAEVALMTAWQSTLALGQPINSWAERMSKLKLQKLHKFSEAGLEQDDLLEVYENLSDLAKCYDMSNAM